MQDLSIIKNENGKQAVQCSQLYKALGLEKDYFNRWVKKNITNNPFAIESEDYTPLNCNEYSLRRKKRDSLPITTPVTLPKEEIRTRNRQRKQDFVLTLDFAKHLAMMCRTKQGYNVRTYFIEYEKIHREKESLIIEVLQKRLSAYERLEQIRLIRLELNKEVRELKTVLASTPQLIDPLTNQLTLNFN
jgi:anti-repressor protein